MKKSQYSIEFLIFFAILSIVFFGWLIIFSDINDNILFTKNRAAFNDVGTAIQTHISLASDLHSGYNSTSLIIADKINGNDFIVNNSFYVFFLRSNNQDYIFQIPYTIGKLQKGLNTVWNLGGVVALNNYTPIIRDDGNINFSECSDFIDNDGDGTIDISQDLDCQEWFDDDESLPSTQCDEAWCTPYTGVPQSPPPVGGTLVLHLDPTSIQHTGLVVDGWDDLTGGSNLVNSGMAGEEPGYRTDVIGEHDGVYFDGSDDYLFVDGPILVNEYYIFAVVYHNSISNGGEVISTRNTVSSNPPTMAQDVSGKVDWFVDSNKASVSVSSDRWNVYTLHGLHPTNNYIALDGGTKNTVASSGVNFELITLGAYSMPSLALSFSEVTITEVLVYESLPVGDVTKIETYLKNKYQTP